MLLFGLVFLAGLCVGIAGTAVFVVYDFDHLPARTDQLILDPGGPHA